MFVEINSLVCWGEHISLFGETVLFVKVTNLSGLNSLPCGSNKLCFPKRVVQFVGGNSEVCLSKLSSLPEPTAQHVEAKNSV